MEPLSQLWVWLTQSTTWTGSGGIPTRVLEHLTISAVAVAAAIAVALPLGLYIGHARKGEFAIVTLANLGRAVPSFAVLALVFLLALPFGLAFSIVPIVVAMFLLGIPPILLNAYVGVKGVDADTVEAARGMGMTGGEVLRSIELPLAAPVIVAGIRTSAVQVVATATLGAVVAGGGLGRYIVDGFAQRHHGMLLGGALLVALLAMLTEVGLGVVQRAVRPRTVSGRDAEGPSEPAAEVVPAGPRA